MKNFPPVPPFPLMIEQKKQTKDTALKTEDFIMSLGDLSLDEIVGQEEAIGELKSLVSMIRFKTLYGTWGVKPPRGILLSGSPGTGKTASVKALGRELQKEVALMELRYIDIASKWVDAPIEHLRNFFRLVEEQSQKKHVIIFIDEIEALLPSRDNEIHETSMKRVNVFLEWMDGGFSTVKNVTIVGATNNLNAVDKAARRPGRIDKIVKFNDLSAEAAIHGLSIHLSKRKLQEHQLDEIEWESLINQIKTGTLTGADLPEVVNRIINEKIESHKSNIRTAYPEMSFNTPDSAQLQSILDNRALYPQPISTDDISIAIGKYVTHKRAIGDLRDGTKLGFTLSTSTY